MDLAYLGALYGYNRWANEKVLAAAATLDEEKFKREMGNSFSSVRDTLVHLFGGEWIWLERWNGRSPRGLPTVAEVPDLATIRAKWARVAEEQRRFLGQLQPSDLEKAVSYVNSLGETWTYPLWQQMAHVVNHSSYHRGQITTLLRQLGAKAPGTDFLRYYAEGASNSPQG
jgi:uncharacterized damage-inducible protein DinB